MNLPEEDITLDPEWIEEQVDRLAAWEYFNRYVKHELDQPMRPQELCDRIGVHKGYIHEMAKSVRRKLNAK